MSAGSDFLQRLIDAVVRAIAIFLCELRRVIGPSDAVLNNAFNIGAWGLHGWLEKRAVAPTAP